MQKKHKDGHCEERGCGKASRPREGHLQRAGGIKGTSGVSLDSLSFLMEIQSTHSLLPTKNMYAIIQGTLNKHQLCARQLSLEGYDGAYSTRQERSVCSQLLSQEGRQTPTNYKYPGRSSRQAWLTQLQNVSTLDIFPTPRCPFSTEASITSYQTIASYFLAPTSFQPPPYLSTLHRGLSNRIIRPCDSRAQNPLAS